ncbi:MAG: transposase [Thermoanaerobaculia bacterium]|nr:transposase [Thermoanaerobaculia bacterium]
MTECNEQLVLFHVGRREVTAAFDGGSVTSDAGVLLLSQMDRRERLTATMAEALSDRRQPGKVRHAIRDLLAQRIYQIACGWEDATDSNTLRYDPGLQTVLQRVAGMPESVLASQPTLSRLEEKIRPEELEALGDWLLERYVEWLRGQGPQAWRRIILDVDSTDDPTHGAQQMTMFQSLFASRYAIRLGRVLAQTWRPSWRARLLRLWGGAPGTDVIRFRSVVTGSVSISASLARERLTAAPTAFVVAGSPSSRPSRSVSSRGIARRGRRSRLHSTFLLPIPHWPATSQNAEGLAFQRGAALPVRTGISFTRGDPRTAPRRPPRPGPRGRACRAA